MEKDIIIEVCGLQNYDDQEPDGVELVTEGTYAEKDDGIYISYEESEMTGMECTTTTMKIEDERVSIVRAGAVRSHMVFEEGQKHLSYYDTPYGSLTIGVRARSISKKITPVGGTVEISYTMEINSALAGENSFRFKFRNA